MNLDSIDKKISARIATFDPNSVPFKIAAFCAHSGDSWFWCAVLFSFWLFAEDKTRQVLAFWGLSIAITAVMIFFVKKIFRRKRPEGSWGSIYRRNDPHSFPSGHAVRAGLIMMLALNTFGFPLFWLFVFWGVIMSFSRIVTGVHFFLDVVGGLLIGLLIGAVLITTQPWIFATFPWLFDFSIRRFIH